MMLRCTLSVCWLHVQRTLCYIPSCWLEKPWFIDWVSIAGALGRGHDEHYSFRFSALQPTIDKRDS